MALLWRLAVVRGGVGCGVSGGGGGGGGVSGGGVSGCGGGGGGGGGGASPVSAVTPEPISRAELRAARRRLLARLEQSGSGRQTDRAGRMLRLYGSLTVNDLHEAFMRVDTAAMFAPEESGTSEAELV